MPLWERIFGSTVKKLLKDGKYDEVASRAKEDKNVVLEVTELLGDEHEYVRSDAAEALGKIAEKDAEVVKPAVPQLTELLGDEDEWVRVHAAEALGRIGGKDAEVVKPAVPQLTGLLGDAVAVVRVHAAGALGRIGGKDAEVVKPAVPRLMELLGDKDSWVRDRAIGMLKVIVEKEPRVVEPAVPQLIALLRDRDRRVREEAADMLKVIVEKEPRVVEAAVPQLTELLRDANTRVRWGAAEALGWIGDAAALEPLRSLTGDNARIRVWREGKEIRATVGQIAREAIKRIEAKQKERAPISPAVTPKPSREQPPAVTPPSLEDYCELLDVSPYACGGFADIFRARVKQSGEVVAVKLPRMPREAGITPTLEAEVREEFLREADKWSRLRHLHILAVRAWGDKPLPWIAMEFAPEGSLRKRLREGRLSLREAVRCLAVCSPPRGGAPGYQAGEHPVPGGASPG